MTITFSPEHEAVLRLADALEALDEAREACERAGLEDELCEISAARAPLYLIHARMMRERVGLS